MDTALVAGKIQEVKQEMMGAGIWKHELPAWVNAYQEHCPESDNNFTDWLQFVYLPNLLSDERILTRNEKKLIVPQAIRFFGDDMRKGALLRLLIELDALT